MGGRPGEHDVWRQWRTGLVAVGLAGCLGACGDGDDPIEPNTAANVPGTYRHTIVVDGSDREFIVYVPQPAEGDGRAPVVFMFHGTSGDGQRFYNISRWREKADETGLIAVFPTALVYCFREDENFDSDFDDPGERKVTTKWTAGKLGDDDRLPLCSEEEVDQLPQPQRGLADHPIRDDVAFVDAMLDYMIANYSVDAARFYATGFSNGAAMTARLTAEMADRFAASASAAGGVQIANSERASRPISAVLSIGELDEGFARVITGGTSIPLNEQIITNPTFRQGLLDPFLHVLSLSDEYTYGEETVAGARVVRFTFQTSNSGAANSLHVLLIEGLGHSYPNGTNHPIIIANHLWEFFRTRTLADQSEQ